MLKKIGRMIKKFVTKSDPDEDKDKYHKDLIENVKSKLVNSRDRFLLLNGIPVKYIIKYANDLIPDKIKDENLLPKIKRKLGAHQKNTGIYLWKRGYDPIKCIGLGANGVYWQCKDKDGKYLAVKVTSDSSVFDLLKIGAVREEIKNSEELKKMLDEMGNDASDDKALEYMVTTSHDKFSDKKTGKNRAVFVSGLADTDVESYRSKKEDYKRFIEILDTGINILKGLKILHDAGFSHNDLKPDNLLVFKKDAEKAVQQAEKNKDGDDVTVKLADFGCITKIDSKLHQKWFANRYFCAPDMQNLREEAVAKRDVYSLGAVLLYLLLNCPKEKAKQWAKKLEYSRNLDKFCDSKEVRFQLGENLLMKYDPTFKAEKAKKIKAFLSVVQKMVASSYSNRLSVDESLQQMKIVSHIMA